MTFISNYKHYIAGGLAGSSAAIIGMPFNTIIHVQQKTSLPTNKAIINLWQSGNYQRFYRGGQIALPLVTVSRAMQFGGSEKISEKLESMMPKPYANVVGSMGAAATKQLILHPFDNMKINLQIYPKDSALVHVKRLSTINGLKSLYTGFNNSLSKTVIGFTIYSNLLRYIDSKLDIPYKNAITGLMAGGIAQTIVYPIDMARTHKFTTTKELSNVSIWKGIKSRLWIFRGLPISVLARAIDGAIFYTLYKKYEQLIDNHSV